jgi:hypothetical protein
MMSHHLSTPQDTNVGTAVKDAQTDALRKAMIAELRGMTAMKGW